MWLGHSHSRVRCRLTSALLLAFVGGCGSSHKYVGTSDEVWAATVTAIMNEYRQGEVFPGRSGEGAGEFFIPVRTSDAVDRDRGQITLDMPGVFLTSVSEA